MNVTCVHDGGFLSALQGKKGALHFPAIKHNCEWKWKVWWVTETEAQELGHCSNTFEGECMGMLFFHHVHLLYGWTQVQYTIKLVWSHVKSTCIIMHHVCFRFGTLMWKWDRNPRQTENRKCVSMLWVWGSVYTAEQDALSCIYLWTS